MSIDREESLFHTVSGNHQKRDLPEFIQVMSDPYLSCEGWIGIYEGVILGGADRFFGLDDLNLWIRRHKYAAYNLDILIPVTHMCLEYAVRCRLAKERPGIPVMARRAAEEHLRQDPLRFRVTSRWWMKIYWLAQEFPELLYEDSLGVPAQDSAAETDVLSNPAQNPISETDVLSNPAQDSVSETDNSNVSTENPTSTGDRPESQSLPSASEHNDIVGLKHNPGFENDYQRILAQLSAFGDDRLQKFLRLTRESANCTDARSMVEQAVSLYKAIFTRYFAADQSTDFRLSADDMAEALASGFERDDAPEDPEKLSDDQRELSYEMNSFGEGESIFLTEEDLAYIPEYIAANFGPTYKKASEMEEIENSLCTEIHRGRKLLFTDGLPESEYTDETGKGRALVASRKANHLLLDAHKDAARQGIRNIELAFRNAIQLNNDPDVYRADRGTLEPRALWKVGRLDDPELFQRIVREENHSLTVDLLIDASGSQSVRQSMVALQCYMFSSALSRIGIPHRVMSYLTYGDHTVLRRYRDFDSGEAADRKILEFQATSNNRDGLALAAAGWDLKKRREDNKIMIVFSDGLPNDMVAGRVRAGDPQKYVGDAAVRDTCDQVRKLRREGIQILGIFLGNDNELANERMIYGSSFLRIRRVEDFSGTAGKRLSEALQISL